MFKSIFAALGFSMVCRLSAQLPAVYGTVSDAATHEKLHGAIIADSLALISTYSNKDGYYLLGLSSGSHTITFSAAGYRSSKMELSSYSPVELHIELQPMDVSEIDTASNVQHALFDYRSAHVAPAITQLKDMPALLCEPDPVKFLQFLPGVNGGIEGLAGMYVRGGNSDQNLITMDGLPIYGNGHIFGLLSNFNPDQIRDMQFYKGVAPARYGGRAGAVLDVSMLDGNAKEWTGNFGANLLDLKLNANGPVSGDGRTTLSMGIRRSWLDLLLQKGGEQYLIYTFHDMNAKLVHRINKTDKFSAWVYNGRDKFNTRDTTQERDSANRFSTVTLKYQVIYQNTLSGMSYSHMFSKNLYSNFMLGLSRYSYQLPFEFKREIESDSAIDRAIYNYNLSNYINDLVARADFEYRLGSNSFRFGLEGIRHDFKPSVEMHELLRNGNVSFRDTFGKQNVQHSYESAAYAELETNLGPGLSLNTGLRLWAFLAEGKTYFRPEPRIFIKQIFNSASALKLSFSMANQGVHQLASVGGTLPGNVWFPTSGNIRPQRNTQVNLGYSKPLAHGIEIAADIYYKWMDGITELTGADGGDLLPRYWEKVLAQGKGTAYGFELMAMKKFGLINGLVSYTLAKTDRVVPGVNFGKTYPFRWDRRHKFSMEMVFNIRSDWKLNAGIVLMTGNAVSVPTSKYLAANGTMVLNYTDKNNFRMPFYKRFDIGFIHEIKEEKHLDKEYKQFWGMNIYNMTNAINPLSVSLSTGDKGNRGPISVRGISYFPILPSIFFRIEF